MSRNMIIGAVVGVLILLVGGFLVKSMMFRNASTQTYSNDEGSVTVGQSVTMPSSWPEDAPANYSGATIVYAGNANPQTGKSGAVVSYTVNGAKTEDIANYYKKTLTEKGWTISGDANIGGQMVIGATKGDRTFGANIVSADNGMVTVTAGLEL